VHPLPEKDVPAVLVAKITCAELFTVRARAPSVCDEIFPKLLMQ
jgi:hypothetical protein